MAIIQSLTATILIQVGADEPKPIGTVEIPIELNVPSRTGFNFPPGVRGIQPNWGYRGDPNDECPDGHQAA